MVSERILLCILDWGLGHATRCLPLIAQLESEGRTVLPASAGRAHALLQQELPDREIIELPAYGIRYRYPSMVVNMALQGPSLLRTVVAEHRAVRRLVRMHNIDRIVSDNRFGCFHPAVPSVFMTHQVHLLTPSRWSSWLANRLNHFFIRRYDELWIPDEAGDAALAGSLSRPLPDFPTSYLGVLTRMQPCVSHSTKTDYTYDLIAVLSGPEPQRTHLEQSLLTQLRDTEYRTLIVRGLPDAPDKLEFDLPHVEVVNFLAAEGLQRAICASRMVLSRSGYSTIMDMHRLGKPAIYIPTPGQTEQKYLAERLHRQGQCVAMSQGAFRLEWAMQEARKLT